MIEAFIRLRMAIGAAALALYGLWLAWVRLPQELATTTWLGSLAWAIGIFAGAGMIIGAAAGIAAILCSWPVRLPRRAVIAACIETGIIVPLFAWLLLNEFVYSTTSEVLGLNSLSLLWYNTAAVLENAWEMGAKYLMTVVLFSLAAVVVIYRFSARSFRKLWSDGLDKRALSGQVLPRSHPMRLAGSMTGVLVVLAGLLGWQAYSSPSAALTTLLRSAPPLRAFDLTRTLVGVDLTGPVPEHFGEPTITDAEYQATMGTPRTPPPNIVFILLESVPAKALHCYGYPRSDITPNIDALACEGVLFAHCMGAAPFSSYGLVSMMTSLYMLRGQRYDHFADRSFPWMGLPRVLKSAGYELTLFSSGNEAFDDISEFYPRQDFDIFFSHDTCDIKKTDCMRMDDQYAVGEFERWISQRSDPRAFYSGFYLQSTHFNYEVPEPWFSYYQPVPPLYSNGDGIIHIPSEVLPLLKNQYDNAMRYADYWVGRIRAALASAGQLDNSIILIIGDHGEAFMEHGLARHGVHVWEEMIHIPLIIYVGRDILQTLSHALPSRVADTVSGIDIAPTIAGLVGIKPHPSWQGMNVMDPDYTSRDRPIFSILQLTRWQEVVCLNKFKYIYDLADVQSMLFNLNADPGEHDNLIDREPALADALRAILGGWHAYQLAYYSTDNRPFTHYIGRYEPPADLVHNLRYAN